MLSLQAVLSGDYPNLLHRPKARCAKRRGVDARTSLTPFRQPFVTLYALTFFFSNWVRRRNSHAK